MCFSYGRAVSFSHTFMTDCNFTKGIVEMMFNYSTVDLEGLNIP